MGEYIGYVAVVIIFASTFFDALRDAWMRSEGWWKRHIVKWVSFYAPLSFIMFVHTSWQLWIPLIIGSWITWRMSLRYVGGVEWESMWVRWFKDTIG